ncbi:hypothetical protein AcW1_007749 [Taiwanofungus camphoratus]|nr:hypothetical protein AcW1_007749 [Antrodia cinnamomea]
MYSLPATLFPKSMNGSKPIILAFGYVFDFALTLDSGRLFTYIDNCLGSTEVIYWRPESSVFLACKSHQSLLDLTDSQNTIQCHIQVRSSSLIIVSLELSTVRRADALISRPLVGRRYEMILVSSIAIVLASVVIILSAFNTQGNTIPFMIHNVWLPFTFAAGCACFVAVVAQTGRNDHNNLCNKLIKGLLASNFAVNIGMASSTLGGEEYDFLRHLKEAGLV